MADVNPWTDERIKKHIEFLESFTDPETRLVTSREVAFARELLALRAIVGDLLRTADGKIVTDCMPIYDGNGKKWFADFIVSADQIKPSAAHKNHQREWMRRFYSTRAAAAAVADAADAALAAAEAAKGNK